MPSRFHAKSSGVYMDEFDISGLSNAVSIEFRNGLAAVTAFADVDATYVEGKPGFGVDVKSMYSLAGPDYDSEMFTNLAVLSRRLGIFQGRVKGDWGYEFLTNVGTTPRVARTGSVIALDASWRGEAPTARGLLLDVDTAVAASGNGTGYQMGSVAATQTLVGVLRLLAAPGGAGANGLTVIVQSSVDNTWAAPTTRLSFTQVTEASVALFEAMQLAGPVTDTWWRVNYTYAGAGNRTFSLVLSLGVRAT